MLGNKIWYDMYDTEDMFISNDLCINKDMYKWIMNQNGGSPGDIDHIS